jgi:hypothetical protein
MSLPNRSSSSWICGVCTFENAAGFTCSMCNTQDATRKALLNTSTTSTPTTATAAAAPVVAAADAIDGWSCPTCTVVNSDEESDECEVCGSTNQQRVDDRAEQAERTRIEEVGKVQTFMFLLALLLLLSPFVYICDTSDDNGNGSLGEAQSGGR